MQTPTRRRLRGLSLGSAALAIFASSWTGDLSAQGHKSNGPLLIRDQGNFYVSGEKVQTPYNDTCRQALGCPGTAPFPGGTNFVNQAYVDYQFPWQKTFNYPIIFAHGGGHHGGYYESTPDRREGWRTYFVRSGFDTYVIDDVNRGRSGYDIRSIVAAVWGDIPASEIDRINKYSFERAWTGFRLGPTYGAAYPDTRFPIEFFDEYAAQLVPSFRLPIETDRNVAAFVALVDSIGPSVLVTWSQSGQFGWLAALQRPDKFKAIIALEGGYPNLSTPQNVAVYSKIPIMFVLGDRRDDVAAAHAAEQTLLNAGGIAKALVLPEVGIRGNSHVFVVEKNNLQIADLIIQWLKTNVSPKCKGHSCARK